MVSLLIPLLCILHSTRVAGQSNLTVEIAPEDTFLLPSPFNNTFDQLFVNATDIPSNSAANHTVTAACSASFIPYDEDFFKSLARVRKLNSRQQAAAPSIV
jgi:hypothetical protein